MNRVTFVFIALFFCVLAAAQPLSDNPSISWPVYLASTGFKGLYQIEVENSPAPSISPRSSIPEDKTQSGPGQPLEDKRLFGVLPNYRTAEGSVPFQPITTKQKFMIATKDSFDYPVLGTTGFFAGLSQLRGSNNEVYGQGLKGFGHRYVISYADQVLGNYFPEAIVPTLFHKDPRYFRKGEGSFGSRLFYAVSHIFVSKSDTGATTFNSPEILGNALAATVSMAYHPHERTIGDAVSQWGATYITSDMVGQVLKEFWPDVKRKFFKKQEFAGK
jgi:hypothetical protein